MIVGIEISADVLRAVTFDRYKEGRSPLRTTEVPAKHELADAVARLIEELDPGRFAPAVAIPSAWCSYRVVSFPYRSASRVEGTLRYSLEGRLVGPIEEYVIEPVSSISPVGAGGARVLVAACPVERLKAVLGAFASTGVEPCIVQPAVISLARYVGSMDSQNVTRNTLLIRFEGGVCEVVLLSGGGPVACDIVRLGHLNPANPQDADVIARKVRFAVGAWEIGAGWPEYERVMLIAPGMRDDSIAESLEQHLSAPVEKFSSTAQDGLWAAACGAAADAARRKHAAPNLRRAEFAYRPYAGRLERRFVASLALAVGIMCVLAVRAVLGIGGTGQQLRDIQHRQSKVFEALGESGYPSIRKAKAALAALKEKVGLAGESRLVSGLARWKELMDLTPDKDKIRFRKIDISPRRLSVEAEVSDDDIATEFKERLGQSKMFEPEPFTLDPNPHGGGSTYIMKMDVRYGR